MYECLIYEVPDDGYSQPGWSLAVVFSSENFTLLLGVDVYVWSFFDNYSRRG